MLAIFPDASVLYQIVMIVILSVTTAH